MTQHYVEYRLRFLSPLRVGDAHWAKANAFPRLHSDLLYRAVAHAYAELHGSPVDEALPGGAHEPRLRLSSALPYTAAHGALAPVPANWSQHAPDRLVTVAPPHTAFAGAGTDAAVVGAAWLVTRRVQASFNRLTARRTQRFATGEVRFAEGAGLWLGVRFADAAADRAGFEAALRYLGDSGIGGGRSVGCGRFVVAEAHERTLDTAAAAWWVLSRYRPSEREFAEGRLLAAGGSATAAVWDSWPAPSGAALRFLAEGSVIAGHDALDPETAGTGVALPRSGSGAAAAAGTRPMIRSGFLFALPLPVEPAVAPSPPAAAATAPPTLAPLAQPQPQPQQRPAREEGGQPGAAAAAPAPQPAPAPEHTPTPKTVVPPPGDASGPAEPDARPDANAEGPPAEPR